MAAGQVVTVGAVLRQYRRAVGLAQQALAWRSEPVPPLRPSAPWNGAFGAGPSQHRGHRRSGAHELGCHTGGWDTLDPAWPLLNQMHAVRCEPTQMQIRPCRYKTIDEGNLS
jgi:hypothetical protein